MVAARAFRQKCALRGIQPLSGRVSVEAGADVAKRAYLSTTLWQRKKDIDVDSLVVAIDIEGSG